MDGVEAVCFVDYWPCCVITFITGAPGVGKTAALVSLLDETLKAAGRPIYVFNIPNLLIPHEVLVDPNTWPDTVPDGAIVIIDEVQDIWRPRGPGQKVPDHISKLETHRHRGLDFYIISQGPNLVDSNVRALVGRHVHLRDVGFLGRWWYEWPECSDNCRVSWKNAPIKKKYKLPAKIFGQYKSSSLHVKPIRSFPKMLVVAVVAVLLTAFLAFRMFGIITSKVAPTAPAAAGASAAPGSFSGGASKIHAPDEKTDFIPRVAGRPWTSPAYDDLRKVVAMPLITGAICVDQACKCYHNGLLLRTVSTAACGAWAAEPDFNPYVADSVPVEPMPRETSPVVASSR
jgi:zona occludens toxin